MKTVIKLNNDTIIIKSQFIGEKTSLWGASANQHNQIAIINGNDKRVVFDYWGSVAHPTINDKCQLLEAFNAVLSDAVCGYMGFYEFCNEFGYDVDEQESKDKAMGIYNACGNARVKIERLNFESDLEDLYNYIDEIVEDLYEDDLENMFS